jgi:hypothetical protein
MEPTQNSETSAFNTQTPGKYPEDNLSTLMLFEKKRRDVRKRTEYAKSHKVYDVAGLAL